MAILTLASATAPLLFFFPKLSPPPDPPSPLSLSLNSLVIPLRLFFRASFPIEPSLRIMTLADETVDEREMLSVEALNRPLNSDRDFGFVVRMEGSAAAVPAEDEPAIVPAMLEAEGEVVPSCPEELGGALVSSSALSVNARLNRLLRPPDREACTCGACGNNSLSSLLRRLFALLVPSNVVGCWDNGLGFTVLVAAARFTGDGGCGDCCCCPGWGGVFDPTLEFECWRIDGGRSLEFDTVRWCGKGGPRAVGEPVESERTRVSGAFVEIGGIRPCPRGLPEGLPWTE